MAKTEKDTEILTEYAFPELGVTVKAKDLATATSMARMHPDVIYKDEPNQGQAQEPEPAAE